MLISSSSLDTAFAKRIMTSGRSPCIIDEDRFETSHHYLLLILLTTSHLFRGVRLMETTPRFITREHSCSSFFAYLCRFRESPTPLP
jgi:hypothetical protein